MEKVDGSCIGKLNQPQSDDLENDNEIEVLTPTNSNNNTIALMPIDQNEENYKMMHHSRGLLLCFNHETFGPSTRQPERSGTEKDVEKIKGCFSKLGFEICIYQDLKLCEIRKTIFECVNHNHTDHDCLAIFVLSHGKKDLVWAKDDWYNPAAELWSKLTSDKCPTLAGKPKLIFLQTCQGNFFDKGIKLVAQPPPQTEFDGAVCSYEMPVCADFLIMYASFEGYFAFRNNSLGSKWISILCEVLKDHYSKKDILEILTIVHRRMAVEFKSVNEVDKTRDGMKQVPYFKSSLTRTLVFGEKIIPNFSG